MSLLLNGSKTATIAGTPLQCIEVYNGESYTLPFSFTTSTGAPVNITGWTLSTSCKWYHANINYPTVQSSTEDILISNLTLLDPQPSAPSGLTAAITTGSTGTGYVYIPSTINGGETLTVNDTTTLIAVVTLSVSRTDSVSGQTDLNKEPIGIIVRYL